MQRILIRNATLVTMAATPGDAVGVVRADLLVEGACIARIAADIEVTDAEVIDATGFIVTPGFINAHMHTWS